MKPTKSNFHQIERWFVVLTLVANATGVVLTFFFFFVIFPIQPSQNSVNAIRPVDLALFIGLTGLLLIAGGNMDTRSSGFCYNDR